MYILETFNWCKDGSGLIKIFAMIKTLLNWARIIVPIGIIVWTSLDLYKNVLNPDDKDSRKRILNRLIAAFIVFLTPTLINLIMKVIEIGSGGALNSPFTECWNKVR